MKLHEAIEKILLEKDKQLTGKQIAELINEQRLYKRSDGNPVQSNQIIARINNYPELFYKQDKFIGLKKWGNEKKYKRSLLSKEIEFILEANGDPMSVQTVVDTINIRNEHIEKFDKNITKENILEEVKRNPYVFYLNNEKIELVNWEIDEDVIHQNVLEALAFVYDKPQKNDIDEYSKLIKSLSVSNFKSFSDPQELKLKPITLLFGPNSSGKSSLIHSILYLQNAFEKNELDTYNMKTSGSSVDLGGFKQLLNKHDYQKKLQFSVKIDKVKLSSLSQSIFLGINEIKLNIEIQQPLKSKTRKQIIQKTDNEGFLYDEVPIHEFIPNGEPIVSKYEVLFDSEIALSFEYFNSWNDGLSKYLKIKHLNYSNKVINKIIKKLEQRLLLKKDNDKGIYSELKKIDTQIIEDTLDNIIKYFYVPKIEFIPKRIKTFDEEIINKIGQTNKFSDLENYLIDSFPIAINTILEEIFDTTKSYLKEIKYLGPMRSYPSRNFFSITSNDPNYYSGGAFAWDELRDNDEVREKLNKWLRNKKLKSNYKLEVRKYIDDESVELYKQLVEAGKILDFDLDRLGEAHWAEETANIFKEKIKEKDAIPGIKILELIDLKTDTKVSHKDVGFGISQYIPVLVTAMANKNKIILIEQPEIHLHPALQAELGDVMIESALGENKNTLILENHSETMMLRILRRIRETTLNKNPDLPKITPDDVSLIFVENTKNGTILKNLRIDKMGKIIDPVPGGFFEEDFEELF